MEVDLPEEVSGKEKGSVKDPEEEHIAFLKVVIDLFRQGGDTALDLIFGDVD